MAGAAAPAVDGQPDEVEREKLAQLAAELEPGLITAVVRGGRAPHGRHELRPAHDLVADRRDVVLPAAGAQEAQIVLAALVAAEQVAQVAGELDLGGERGGQVELAAHAVRSRDLGEQLLDAVRADRVEHLLLQLGDRVRHVRVCCHVASIGKTTVCPGATRTRR